jgi:hypothetical protein
MEFIAPNQSQEARLLHGVVHRVIMPTQTGDRQKPAKLMPRNSDPESAAVAPECSIPPNFANGPRKEHNSGLLGNRP